MRRSRRWQGGSLAGRGSSRTARTVFHGEKLIAWTATSAHHSDVGGMAPGSLTGEATSIFQEGLRLPVIKIISRGEAIEPVMQVIKVNSRMPDVLEGDLWAAIASVRVGARRIEALAGKYGMDTFTAGRARRLVREVTYETSRMLRTMLVTDPDLASRMEKVRVFLSHSKHDDVGERTAQCIRDWLRDDVQLSVFQQFSVSGLSGVERGKLAA